MRLDDSNDQAHVLITRNVPNEHSYYPRQVQRSDVATPDLADPPNAPLQPGHGHLADPVQVQGDEHQPMIRELRDPEHFGNPENVGREFVACR